ncbi:MAG: response regulator transcription factor [Clostridia bacterium]|nr:response regulator transcription factor [Clostridia bacterium]MBQ9856827.1 response regulator transcription factor [Clostridia bacterium]
MIYYVEDDDSIRELVVYTLCQMGMETKGFAAPVDFWSQMEIGLPALILLDVMLPGEDGLHILSRLHENPNTVDIPVIMITAKGTEFDKVKGLDLGADDYIAKPFGMAELIARVRARLRRITPKEQADALTIGSVSIDKRAHIVYLDNKPLPLTLKEYDLLCLLMENPGRAFSREHLLEAVWDIAYSGGTRTVDVHIQTLRSKMGDLSCLIETVRGVGYRFGGK